MEIWIIYAIIALSIALTSYINIYKPALDLYIEITEEESPIIASTVYNVVWVIIAFTMAPFVAFMLFRGRNDNYIRDLVIAWIGDE